MKKYKGDVLFLCQYFYPEYNSSALLPWDTAVYLAKSGIKVGALCGYPKEYVVDENVPDTELTDNVSIKRLHYLSLKRGKKITRLINFSSFTIRVILYLKEIGRYKSVLVYSNPPILPIAAIIAHKIYGTKIMFVSYDVYPEIASISEKIATDGIITKAMNLVNRSLFKSVSGIVALSDDMKDYLLAHRRGIIQSKISVIPNWAHEGVCTLPSNELKQKHGFPENAFVVSYLGNMGICQDMQTIIDAVKILSREDNIYFVFAGHGAKRELIEQTFSNNPKVKLLGYLTGNEFEEVLALSSCGIVSLNSGLNGKCAPSKYYSYLQSGCAILSVMEKDAYVSREIEEKHAGYSVANGDSGALAEAILNLRNDSEKFGHMSSMAATLYKEKYNKPIAMNKYAHMVKSVVSSDL
jgi:glycosyltransferase involved in cell wall biosynthesis